MDDNYNMYIKPQILNRYVIDSAYNKATDYRRCPDASAEASH
jgi:hypothetical protein